MRLLEKAFALVCIAALTACSQAASAPQAPASSGSEIVGVASVTDGDTIEIHGQAIRLSGVDSPERGATCGDVNVYQRAALALSDYIDGRTVTCATSGNDRYGRAIGTCSVGGVDLAEHMTREGWTRDWPRYSNRAYADEEREARTAGRGIWGLSCPADLWGTRNYD